MQTLINGFLGGSYQLIDSGDFTKLERFGPMTLVRPSSLCMWKRRRNSKEWDKADALFDPDKGWSFARNKKFSEWILPCRDFKLKLRLQTNGQVGIFPEHAYYLDSVCQFLKDLRKDRQSAPRVLNLFAYSGMASMACISEGAEVCHVDSSKKALDWAKENLQLNEYPATALRLIPDDALGFLKRESRRGSRYDVVILDPPSFSRLDGRKTWKLEESIYEFISSAVSILEERSLLVFSCHHHALDSRMLKNIFLTELPAGMSMLDAKDLDLAEEGGQRVVPAGCVLIAGRA